MARCDANALFYNHLVKNVPKSSDANLLALESGMNIATTFSQIHKINNGSVVSDENFCLELDKLSYDDAVIRIKKDIGKRINS
jgi:hypothetical protein